MHRNEWKWKHDSQNLWDSVKAAITGRFIAIQAYLKKQEKNQINNLSLHLKQIEKEEMKKLRVRRIKEIIKIMEEYAISDFRSVWWRQIKLVIIMPHQIRSVAQLCPTLCDPMNRSTPGLPVHHQLPEFTQTYIHWVGDAIQPSHPLLSPSPPAPIPSQHQGLFQWVNSWHEVAKVLEFQL